MRTEQADLLLRSEGNALGELSDWLRPWGYTMVSPESGEVVRLDGEGTSIGSSESGLASTLEMDGEVAFKLWSPPLGSVYTQLWAINAEVVHEYYGFHATGVVEIWGTVAALLARFLDLTQTNRALALAVTVSDYDSHVEARKLRNGSVALRIEDAPDLLAVSPALVDLEGIEHVSAHQQTTVVGNCTLWLRESTGPLARLAGLLM
jgi:hypothetical protein